jgi:hypothetical protein
LSVQPSLSLNILKLIAGSLASSSEFSSVPGMTWPLTTNSPFSPLWTSAPCSLAKRLYAEQGIDILRHKTEKMAAT